VFGDDWMKDDITDFIKKDLSTFRPLVLAEGIADSIQELQSGMIPKLKAFSLFNGTIYRWNRPCYGITNGKPHLRIENRYIPSGPSIKDEVANTAFWTGLMNGIPSPSISQTMEFHEAKENFIKAARHGLAAKLNWQGSAYDARELIIEELIPLAKSGLARANVDEQDLKYLEILQDRVAAAKTGASWILNSFNRLSNANSHHITLATIVAGIRSRQSQNIPVHRWTEIGADEIIDGAFSYQRVDQIMSKELYTVFEEDLIDLVPNIMKWNQVRHMLVENREGDLVGLVTLGRLGKYYSEHHDSRPVMVKEVMIDDVITVTPGTPTLEAISLMQKHKIGCLPVLNQHQKLVGVITEKDILPIAASYLKSDKTQ
jgi:CBS domain-containing protein